MSERGVFAVDRGIWDHDVLVSSDPFSRREAWLWLLSEAAWKPHRRRLAGKPIEVGRGQVAASLRFIASKWRWSEPRVRRFLAALISDEMIDAKTDAGVTVITICKYDQYQRVSLPADATSESDDDAGATQERRKVEDKEYKEKNFAPGGAPSKYFFETGCIRLTERDFRKWQDAFGNLELKAELISLAQWAGTQPDWFFAVSGALAKRNRQIGEARKKPPPQQASLTKAQQLYREGLV